MKVIEELQADSLILFLTDEASLVLATIKSRCQQVNFFKNEPYLEELFAKSQKVLQAISALE